jgi:hypothetical protein
MVLSPPQSLNTSFSPPPDLSVSDLIEDNSISWNSSLIHNIFYPISATQILNIHLPLFPRDDRLVWAPSHELLIQS